VEVIELEERVIVKLKEIKKGGIKMKTNNTKGAIEFCEDLKEVDFTYCKKSYDLNKYINNIIELLQRGEKFEAMWGDVEHLFSDYAESNLKHIKQKYFPKGDGKNKY